MGTTIRELWDNFIAKLKAMSGRFEAMSETPEFEFLEQLKERIHELETWQANEINFTNALQDRIKYLETYVVPEGAVSLVDTLNQNLPQIMKLIAAGAAAQGPAADPAQGPAADPAQGPAADPANSIAAAVDASVGPMGHA